jgi:acetyl esterase
MATTVAAPPRTEHAIEVEDVEYLRHGGQPLLARLYKPKGKGPFPLLVDAHGGAWCNGDRLNDTALCEAIAKSGVVVAALDFRMPPTAGYPASFADIHYGVRWLKDHAKGLNGRADKVGLIGVSSGGHQVMLLAMRPNDPRYAALPLAGDAKVQAVVMVWPVIDPLRRYQYAQKLSASGAERPEQIDRVIPLHVKYWGTEEAMAEGSPLGALERGEKVELPPVLYVQGGKDRVHPRPDLERFVQLYRQKGGALELILPESEGEGFLRSGSPAARDAQVRLIDWLHERLA